MVNGDEPDSFGTRGALEVGGVRYAMHRLDALGGRVARLPFSLRVLLENLLRREDGRSVTRDHVEALLAWDPARQPEREIPFMPARVILQDFTGVPCVVDLAAMRDAMQRLGGDPKRINPLQPVDLVIDHSVQVDAFGTPDAFQQNVEIEYQRNRERYAFLRWGQRAFSNFRVVPPDTGIVHQVNLEYLAPVVATRGTNGQAMLLPDTVLGTDSHTTMINGLGVVGWGVGGIEAEAAMLGQPTVMLIPQVVGFRLHGTLAAGATATDVVLTVTQMLRKRGVVGKFVEFFGPGLREPVARRPRHDRQHGAGVRRHDRLLPGRRRDARLPALTGRDPKLVALVEAYCKAQGLFRTASTPEPEFTDQLELDLGTVEPSLAGPSARRTACRSAPRRRRGRRRWPTSWRESPPIRRRPCRIEMGGQRGELRHGVGGHRGDHELHEHVEPVGDARRRAARAEGRRARPRRQAVGEDQPRARLEGGDALPRGRRPDRRPREARLRPRRLRLHDLHRQLGPCPRAGRAAIETGDLVVAAVLSGNRNFEGRVNPLMRANYLASPPLVVAYALAGTMDFDPATDPLGTDTKGKPVYFRDIWPTPEEVAEALRAVTAERFREEYGARLRGRRALARDAGARRRPLRLGRRVDVHQVAAVLRGHDARAAAARGHPRRARAGAARRLDHHRPHLAGRIDQGGQPGRAST